MDTNVIIQGLLGAFAAVLWYMYRRTEAKADSNEKALLEYRVFCAQTYVTNDQLTQAIADLNRAIEKVANTVLRIENRLDNIVDNQRD